MFEELDGVIREEVVLTLFHAQLQPSSRSSCEPQQGNGGLVVRARDRGRRRRDRRRGRARRRLGRHVVRSAGRRHRDGTAVNDAQGHRPERPVLVRQGQEVQEVPRRLSRLPPHFCVGFVGRPRTGLQVAPAAAFPVQTPRRRNSMTRSILAVWLLLLRRTADPSSAAALRDARRITRPRRSYDRRPRSPHAARSDVSAPFGASARVAAWPRS